MVVVVRIACSLAIWLSSPLGLGLGCLMCALGCEGATRYARAVCLRCMDVVLRCRDVDRMLGSPRRRYAHVVMSHAG